MDEFLRDYTSDLINALENVKQNGPKKYVSYVFDCSFFRKYEMEDIRDSREHDHYQMLLRPISGPTLYWFEILDNFDTELIRLTIKEYRNRRLKSVPAIKKTYDSSSSVLYVGKVKRYFWNRVIQHLGYYSNHRTQGLQIYHWAREFDLKLKLHVYEFEHEMSNLMGPLEYRLARELKPIIGKHT